MKRRAHKNEPIDQNCAINYRIQENASNETTTKSKNLLGVKSILESISLQNTKSWLSFLYDGSVISIPKGLYGGTSITATELSIFISNRAGRDSRDDTQTTCKAQDK